MTKSPASAFRVFARGRTMEARRSVVLDFVVRIPPIGVALIAGRLPVLPGLQREPITRHVYRRCKYGWHRRYQRGFVAVDRTSFAVGVYLPANQLRHDVNFRRSCEQEAREFDREHIEIGRVELDESRDGLHVSLQGEEVVPVQLAAGSLDSHERLFQSHGALSLAAEVASAVDRRR